MNLKSLPLLGSLVFLTSHALGQDPFTYESSRWLSSQADINGDGLFEPILVEKSTGIVQFATAAAGGALSWSGPQPSGIDSPETMAVGRMQNSTRDSFALASRVANRIHHFSPSAPSVILEPVAVFPTSVGPSSLAALPVTAVAPLVDLMAITDGQSPDFYLGNGKTYEVLTGLNTSLYRKNFNVATSRIATVRPKAGGALWLAEIYGTTLYVEQWGAAGSVQSFLTSGVTSNSRFLTTSLDGGALSHFIFWNPGSSSFTQNRVTETASVFGFGANITVNLGKAIDSIVPCSFGTTGRLAVLFTDGTGTIYNYNGTGTPTSVLALPAGQEFFLPLGTGGDFLAAMRNTDDSLSWVRRRWGASSYIATATGTLPSSRKSQSVSNVIFLTAEPFVNQNVGITKLAHFSEWSISKAASGGTQWILQGQSYLDSANGLGNTTLGVLNAVTTDFPLINQYSSSLSIYSLDTRSGNVLRDVEFSPPAGIYPTAVPFSLSSTSVPNISSTLLTVQLTATGGAQEIYYRTNSGALFALLANQGRINLTGTTTVEAYARNSASGRGPLRSATYQFSNNAALSIPAVVDADHDGLGDGWEAAFNATSPTADQDNDGATNLAEYLAQTDPGNASDFPPVLTGTPTTLGASRVLRLQWPSADTQSVLQSSNDMLTWTDVITGIQNSGGSHRLDIPIDPPATRKRFYRLRR